MPLSRHGSVESTRTDRDITLTELSEGSSTSSTHTTASLERFRSIAQSSTVENEIQRLSSATPDPNMFKLARQSALSLIEKLRTSTSRNTFSFPNVDQTVELHSVMEAMLEHAVGSRGTAYVIAVINGCDTGAQKNNNSDHAADYGLLLDNLQAVARTWLTHLLFIFEAGPHGHNSQKIAASPIATPALQQTQSTIVEGADENRSYDTEEVHRRDGFACVVTHIKSDDHPRQGKRDLVLSLVVAHIVRPPAAVFTEGDATVCQDSALTTFDILVNFTRLSRAFLEELQEHNDDITNLMCLHPLVHKYFDKHEFCLTLTDIPNKYKPKYYSEDAKSKISAWIEQIRGDDVEYVTFEDHSDNFPPEKRRKRDEDANQGPSTRNKGKNTERVILPNPRYIEIHAAIAGILHMSGAGKFFDELLDKHGGDSDTKNPPLQCWEDLVTQQELVEL